MQRSDYPVVSFFFILLFIFISSLVSSINLLHSTFHLVLWGIYGCLFILSLHISVPFMYQKIGIFVCFVLAAFLFIGYSLNPSTFSFLSPSSYRFILRIPGGHNHLGDLAGLALIVLLLTRLHPLILTLISLFVSGIMAISFSKSAFLAVLVALFVITVQKRGKYIVLFCIALIISLFSVAVYTSELSHFSPIRHLQNIMTNKMQLYPKSILSSRETYYPQVIRAWKTAPVEQLFFGYGSGNYIYPSIKTGRTTDLTPTETHNIFLSLFIENGVLTFFWFALFCSFVIGIGVKNRIASVYLFIYLLINFQTDFTYAIPFFMALFFLLSGQIVKSSVDKKISASKIVFGVTSIIILFTVSISMYYALLQKNVNKLNNDLKRAISQQSNTRIHVAIAELEKITPYEEVELVRWAKIHEESGNINEAIRLLDKLSIYSPRWYLLSLPHILDLEDQIGNPKKYLRNKKEILNMFPYTKKEREQLNAVCMDYAKMKCID